MVVSTPSSKTTTPTVKAAAPRKNWLGALAAVIACQIAALLFVEAVLYSAGLGEEEIFKLHPSRGVSHLTNKRITYRSEGFAQSYFNEDGMREPGLTVSKPANTYRIATMGDSMVEGMQVPIEKTFGTILGQRLSPMNGKNVQVLNFGISGYSTAQEYLQLKQQVLKYKPDLVVLCYNSRDIFENWSPADQVITNVRPFALDLPGRGLTVDSSPVVRWMGTPRARFLLQTSWLREHSRIYGLLSALELDWSQHNAWYRALLDVYQHPKKAMNELKQSLAAKQAGPAFAIKFFDDREGGKSRNLVKQPASITGVSSLEKPSDAHAFNSAIGNSALSENELLSGHPVGTEFDLGKSADPKATGKAQVSTGKAASPGNSVSAESDAGKTAASAPVFNSAAPNDALSKNPVIVQSLNGNKSTSDSRKEGMNNYRLLISRTLGSLFADMKVNCAKSGSRFVVVSLPSRAQLCPATGMETSFAGIDYPEELSIVSRVCKEKGIAYFNCEESAEQLPYDGRQALFYAVHLTPHGHEFIAEHIQAFVRHQLTGK